MDRGIPFFSEGEKEAVSALNESRQRVITVID
jgi:hypothetical protein